jgi:hypothetical protein
MLGCFRFRDCDAIRRVGGLVGQSRHIARYVASVDVRHEKPQPQTIEVRADTIQSRRLLLRPCTELSRNRALGTNTSPTRNRKSAFTFYGNRPRRVEWRRGVCRVDGRRGK